MVSLIIVKYDKSLAKHTDDGLWLHGVLTVVKQTKHSLIQFGTDVDIGSITD